jgi:membrane associated rhomboid family serine protease
MLREPLTTKLLWATLACLVLTLLPAPVRNELVLWPLDFTAAGPALEVLGKFRPWQLATHLVVDDFGGLLFIALTLFYFGAQLESMWGQRRYGLFLVTCALGAALIQLAVSSAAYAFGVGDYHPQSGSSGAMYAILFALAYIAPYSEVRLWLPPVTMTMRTLVIVFVVIAFVFGVQGEGWLAQLGWLGGMGIAWLHIRYWRGLPPFRRKPPTKKKPHLRAV